MSDADLGVHGAAVVEPHGTALAQAIVHVIPDNHPTTR